ncbi:MAG: polyhydroxyalkanoic acid system family protein [Actinobacteria bacterium]|nr:polyhydroxyalkanoic acid system family protein [Actinomycetota bacterium]MBE3127077.1 polyhydroxyalkanoic acid system family protein [Candidatus Atribacteria bacterium]
MRQKILDRTLAEPINKTIQEHIDKRIEKLKKEFQDKWGISHKWNKKGNKLKVEIADAFGEAIFSKNKVEVFVNAPFYLMPFLEPFRKQVIEVLEKELSKIMA